MQKVNTEDSFQGKKHTIEIQIRMWRYKYKKYKAKQADIIKLVGQSESLAGLSESLAGLSDLGSNLPRLTTWVGRVLLYPVLLSMLFMTAIYTSASMRLSHDRYNH